MESLVELFEQFVLVPGESVAIITTLALSWLADTPPVKDLWDKLTATAKNWVSFAVMLLMPAILWVLACKAGIEIVANTSCPVDVSVVVFGLALGGLLNLAAGRWFHKNINKKRSGNSVN